MAFLTFLLPAVLTEPTVSPGKGTYSVTQFSRRGQGAVTDHRYASWGQCVDPGCDVYHLESTTTVALRNRTSKSFTNRPSVSQPESNFLTFTQGPTHAPQ